MRKQQALGWVRANVPHNSFIVINSYLYVDLRVPGGQGIGDGAPYPHAEVYWNVAGDPELHVQALQNNPDRIDYIVADSEMLPNAPKSTFVIERFIALHITIDRMNPEPPSRVPAMISTLFEIANPVAAEARPA